MDKTNLTAEEAIALLPDPMGNGEREVLHTWLGGFGADWDRGAAVAAIERPGIVRALVRTWLGWALDIPHPDEPKKHLRVDIDERKLMGDVLAPPPVKRSSFIAYVNDEGPSLRVFETEEAARAYCVELDRIVTWRSTRTVDEAHEDEEVDRTSLPPDDWRLPPDVENNRLGNRWDGAVVWFDLPLGGDPVKVAREDATDFNAWGEYEP